MSKVLFKEGDFTKLKAGNPYTIVLATGVNEENQGLAPVQRFLHNSLDFLDRLYAHNQS